MFKSIRPKYVIKKYAGRKFPLKRRSKITDDDIILKYNTPKIVNRGTNITTIGSCFAQRLSEWLIKEEYNYVDGKWDRVYTPRNIKQILKMAFEPETLDITERFWDFGGDWGDPYIKESAGRPLRLPNNVKDAIKKQSEYYHHFKKTLSECEVLIVTYGQTQVWSHKLSPDTSFFTAPFVCINNNENNHICKDLTIDDIKNETKEILRLMTENNPLCKIIFSVSPIPLVASINENYSAYISANLAKTKLHSALLEELEDNDGTYYMPSFEFTNAHVNKAFNEDGRHVEKLFIDKIMGMFQKLFVE